jgi:predicted ArsR family transcriptional regulator
VSRDKNILEANRRSPTGENIQKDSRRQIILAHLKGQDWVSIKDISKAVSGCSVKTVQRELVDLVKSHVLEKTGERRWSRYRLV